MWESLAATLLEWTLCVLGVVFYVIVRCTVLIIRAFMYYGCEQLWISLAVFLSLTVGAYLLATNSNSLALVVPIAASVGFAQLTITAKVVEINGAATFMQVPQTVIGSVLHSNWFQLH